MFIAGVYKIMNKSPVVDDFLVFNKKIKMALMSLNAQKPFAIFDVKFTDDEKNSLDKMHIDDTKAYDNFGNLSELQREVKDFIKSLGNNGADESELIAKLIEKLVNEFILAFEKETAWVTIRSSVATSSWDLPRWHSDGYYYSPYSGDQYKLAIALKGPSTLFYPLPDELRDKFKSLQFNPENREAIAQMLDVSKAIFAAREQGIIFIVGTYDHGAVHSEPPIHEERLFLSVVPGNKSEIQELYNNWSLK